MKGSNLWSWHSQQPSVVPSQAIADRADAVGRVLGEVLFGLAPPSRVIMFRRLKPVATRCSAVGLWQQVAGKLFHGELVERLVAIERLDDVIAIGPGILVLVAVEPDRVGVAGHVQPVLGHALAEMRRLSAVDPLGLRRPWVIEVARGTATSAVVGGRPTKSRLSAAKEGAPVRLGSRLDALGRQGILNEGIDRIASQARKRIRGTRRNVSAPCRPSAPGTLPPMRPSAAAFPSGPG